MLGPLMLGVVLLCYTAVTFDLLMRRDWSGALMTFGSVVFTVGAMWKLYENV
jgi:hypothetical protein